MGSSTTVQNSTSTPQPTANDTALQANELALSNAALPYQKQNQTQAFGLQSNLLSGSTLPGDLAPEPQGATAFTNGYVPQAGAYNSGATPLAALSSSGATPQANIYNNGYNGQVSDIQAQNEAQLGLQGLATQFQGMGGLDSGEYAQAGANAYANTLNQNAQYNATNALNNQQFNTGALNQGSQFNAANNLQNNQFNASQFNTNAGMNASNMLQNNQYNSGVLNQNSQFNAGNTLQNQQYNTANLNQNSQFNIQNLAQLLNLAGGGAYQNIGLASSNNQMLGQQATALAGNQSTGSSTNFANPFSQAISGISGIGGMLTGHGFCWVAAELFDGWSDIRTIQCRFYLMFHSPKWFRNFYYKNGETISKFIHNKPILKNILRPIFEIFSSKGKEKLNAR